MSTDLLDSSVLTRAARRVFSSCRIASESATAASVHAEADAEEAAAAAAEAVELARQAMEEEGNGEQLD